MHFCELHELAEDTEEIGNHGSYIGAYGGELFDRGLDELIFRPAAWATGTQIVWFSKGASELVERDRGGSKDDETRGSESGEILISTLSYTRARTRALRRSR